MPKPPSFPFYPGDWLRNAVAGCSLAAQGLWLRMMILMHDAEVYGELSVKGKPMPDDFIAKKCGLSRKIYQKLLKNLEDFSVVNRKRNGIIFSGRMMRDEDKRQQNAKRQRDFYDAHKDEPNGKPNVEPSKPLLSSLSSLSFPLSSKDLKRLIDCACEGNSKVDPRIVEIAVIETLMKRNGSTAPINSIKYFAPEVERLCSNSEGLKGNTIDVILKRRRQQIAKSFEIE